MDGYVAMSGNRLTSSFPSESSCASSVQATRVPFEQVRISKRMLRTAHKTHTRFAIGAVPANCANRGISNLLKTEHRKSFNSVPGHHINSPVCNGPAFVLIAQSVTRHRHALWLPPLLSSIALLLLANPCNTGNLGLRSRCHHRGSHAC